MSKTIAIGDVHGELDHLKNLFKKLSFTEDDTIIFLGDYIDRGKDSKGVIDFVLSLEDKCNLVTLLGNHERMALESIKWCSGQISNAQMLKSWMMHGGYECLKSYDCEAVRDGYLNRALHKMLELHGQFLNDLKLTYETENHIFVHGFLAHEQDVEDQEEWRCIWNSFREIYPHKSGKTVVCGHSIQRGGVVDDGFRICIDTGSFLPDGYITAMVIDGPKYSFVRSN